MLAPLLLLLALPLAAESVDILRDPNGNPHIFSSTPAGAAFGAGYAQAADRPQALLRNLKSAGSASLDPLSPEMRAILTAFAAGVNRQLPDAQVTAAQVAAFGAKALAQFGGPSIFLDKTRTASGSVMALLETQANWNDQDRPYEMTLTITADRLAGVAPLGIPFPVTGHNQSLVIAWSPGAGSLDQAWAAIHAGDLNQVRQAFARNVPAGLLAGDLSGNLLTTAANGYALQPGRSPQAEGAVRKLLAAQKTWSPGRLENIAFSSEVYLAESWQSRLAKMDPGHPFTRMLTGWNRRATPDSRPALAFYLFKMELGREAPAIQPPDSLSDARLLAALKRAQDKLETGMAFDAAFGTLFRIPRPGGRATDPASGGTVTEAGMETPRALRFEKRGAVSIATGGQSSVRIVDLANPGLAASVLMPDRDARLKPSYFDLKRSDFVSKTLIF